MAVVGIAVGEIEERLGAVRRRANANVLLATVCSSVAVAIGLLEIVLLAALFADSTVFSVVFWASLAFAAGATAWIIADARASLVDRLGAARMADRAAGLDDRLATVAGRPRQMGESPLAHVLVRQLMERRADWREYVVAPRVVPASAYAMAAAAAVLILTLSFAPMPTTPDPQLEPGEPRSAAALARAPAEPVRGGDRAEGSREAKSGGGPGGPDRGGVTAETTAGGHVASDKQSIASATVSERLRKVLLEALRAAPDDGDAIDGKRLALPGSPRGEGLDRAGDEEALAERPSRGSSIAGGREAGDGRPMRDRVAGSEGEAFEGTSAAGAGAGRAVRRDRPLPPNASRGSFPLLLTSFLDAKDRGLVVQAGLSADKPVPADLAPSVRQQRDDPVRRAEIPVHLERFFARLYRDR